MRRSVVSLAVALVATGMAHAAEPPKVSPLPNSPSGIWVPDQGDGSYQNPVLQGDYSDLDAIRVGDDFYLTASSFTNIPGLPVLHSKDLVNWSILGYALERNVPDSHHTAPRRGGGVWAPALRHHNGQFFIYYPDPDFGIFVVTATDPKGPWSKPQLVDNTKGAIDPAPFWDDDGQAWLVHGFANSRAGIKNVITLKKLSQDGAKTLDAGQYIIEGDKLPKVNTSRGLVPWVTTEGPKLYKRDGWYYVFVPSGGVKGGWQGVFRSRSITGPYEGRNVLDQGATEINGPHQGAWVETPSGESWFLHFQDLDSYGRRVLLEPMTWGKDGWPVIGERQKGQSFGQPVIRHRKPNVSNQVIQVPVVDDDFKMGPHLGWQWNANPGDDWINSTAQGRLQLKAVSSSANLWEAGNLLTQKLPGMAFTATTKVSMSPNLPGERAGLLVLGYNYGWIGLENTADGVKLVQVTRPGANLGGAETVLTGVGKVDGPVWVRVHLEPLVVADPEPNLPDSWPSMTRSIHAKATFSYSLDGVVFTSIGPGMMTQPGRWVGAQIGIFAQAASGTPAFTATRVGYADFEFFKVTE